LLIGAYSSGLLYAKKIDPHLITITYHEWVIDYTMKEFQTTYHEFFTWLPKDFEVTFRDIFEPLLPEKAHFIPNSINNNSYLNKLKPVEPKISFSADPSKIIHIRKLTILNNEYQPSLKLNRNDAFHTLIEYDVNKTITPAGIEFMLETIEGTAVIHSNNLNCSEPRTITSEPGKYRATITTPGSILNAGRYKIRIVIGVIGGQIFDHCETSIFELLDDSSSAHIGTGGKPSACIIAIPIQWKIERLA